MVCIFTDSLSLSIVIILFNFYFFLFTLVSATKLHNFSETSKTVSIKKCFASLADYYVSEKLMLMVFYHA